MNGFIRLERKYGITIKEDEMFNPLTGHTVKRYRIYSADGCPWENGLTRDGIKREVERYAGAFLAIKDKVERGVR